MQPLVHTIVIVLIVHFWPSMEGQGSDKKNLQTLHFFSTFLQESRSVKLQHLSVSLREHIGLKCEKIFNLGETAPFASQAKINGGFFNGCNFIAALTLMQQFLIALFFHFYFIVRIEVG